MRAAADGAARREAELLELLALKDEQLRQHSENLRAMGKRARPHSLTAKCLSPSRTRRLSEAATGSPGSNPLAYTHVRARAVTDSDTNRPRSVRSEIERAVHCLPLRLPLLTSV